MADIKGLKILVNMSKGYFLTTVINQALPFLLLPILTRYLDTAEYGSLSLFSFYLTVSNSLVGASIPVVVSKFYFEREKSYIANLIGNCVYTAAIMAGVVFLIILSTYPWIKDLFSISLLWMLMLPVGSFTFVIFSLGLTVCRNSKNVLHFSFIQIGNTLVNILISLLMICVFAWGWTGRALGIIGAYFISAIGVLVYLRKRGFINMRYSSDSQHTIRNVVLPLIPNSVQICIISQVGLFFMQFYFGKDLLGIYAIGFQIAFCVKLLVDTIAMSWSPFLFQQLALGEKMNKMYVARLLWVLFIVLGIGVLVVFILAKPVLWVMTTPGYYSAEQFVPWFCLGMFFYGMYVKIFNITILQLE